MTKAETLRALADRVEQASGPDRTIDADIHYLRNPQYEHMRGTRYRIDDLAPIYTASLDAAMTLVPEGWHVALLTECDEDSNPKCCLIENDDPCRGAVGKGADMILSLCPAALRAHAQDTSK